MTAQTLWYGDERIRYCIDFGSESGRRLAIHVLPSGEVRVDAPKGTQLASIKHAVAKRARWVSDHLKEIRCRRTSVLPREYVSGESHFYLGRRYLLKVSRSRMEAPSVSLRRGRFEVIANGCDGRSVKSMLWDWYRCRARAVFESRLDQMVDNLRWLEKPPPWKLVAMKRQWGSCSPGGMLSLNPHLVKAPRSCIDYVLLHELCHLRFHDHSPSFHRLLVRHMPDWKSIKHRLDDIAEQLLCE